MDNHPTIKVRLLVTGGRDYADADTVNAALDAFDRMFPVGVLIEGGATGADTLARDWANKRGILVITEPVEDWNGIYGKRAGLVRNAKMLRKHQPDYVVAFPGHSGTAHMVFIAQEADVDVLFAKDLLA